jgi:hypothetical protein
MRKILMVCIATNLILSLQAMQRPRSNSLISPETSPRQNARPLSPRQNDENVPQVVPYELQLPEELRQQILSPTYQTSYYCIFTALAKILNGKLIP